VPLVQANIGTGFELARLLFTQDVERPVRISVVLNRTLISWWIGSVSFPVGRPKIDGLLRRKVRLHPVGQTDEPTRIIGSIREETRADVYLDTGVG
jgi:hypothetical protein